jgi:S-adenosylmethionine synthetase
MMTDELVSPGHPDKIADKISDTLLTKALQKDKYSKVAIETFITGTKDGGLVVVGGEITKDTLTNDEVEKTVLEVLKTYIKTNDDEFDLKKVKIQNVLTAQSPEIRRAVLSQKNFGAGDQGIMIGYAENTNDLFLPNNFYKALKIMQQVYALQKYRDDLDLDSKVQLTDLGTQFKAIVSTQHDKQWAEEKIDELIDTIVANTLQTHNYKLLVNPSGSFTKGGPAADTGLTGRKIVVDAYGPSVAVGGGAYSGKDPSKVDRSAAYACRHLAKNVVANGLADKCYVRVAYAIGVEKPIELEVGGFDDLNVSNEALRDFVSNFDMTPKGIIERLDLYNQDYSSLELSHYSNPEFSWERIETR